MQLIMVIVLLVVAHSVGLSRQVGTPVITPAQAPSGAQALAVEWVKVAMPDVGTMLAAVARPGGAGPFPTVVVLHGSHGFAQEYVQIAQALARNGVLAVAACWFSEGRGAGMRFVTTIACPEGPPISEASSAIARRTVDTLVRAARLLPGADPNRVALFGHSRGGGASLHYVLAGGDIRAAVLDSVGYPNELSRQIAGIKTPLLMLHGTADSPADGGSAMTNVQMARAFEQALRDAGKLVEAKYYEGAEHNGLFTTPMQREDAVARMVSFLQTHLGRNR